MGVRTGLVGGTRDLGPGARRGHGAILHDLLVGLDLRAGLVSDAVLAALCLEHGLSIVSADSDFARFPQVTWVNPVAPG